MKFLIFCSLLAMGCSAHLEQPKYKVDYPVLAGDHNYFIEASSDNLGDARQLAYRVMNHSCGMYYPSRILKVQSETFAVDAKQSTVKIQFSCVKGNE